ncbi:MAG: A24 family peptidase [Firmicutes bacterium]|nr:A24 family peptidase [Bacillota bacterium]
MFELIVEISIDILLVMLLILASYTDVKLKIIPNKYTIPALLSGFILMTVKGGFIGLQDSFYGFLLGFFIFLIPFIIGFMGAGDLKLMAAIGALKGLNFTFNSLVAAGLAGGIIVVVYIIYKKQLLQTIINMFGMFIRPITKIIYLNFGNKTARRIFTYFDSVKKENPDLYIPYAIPIAFGTIAVLIGNVSNLL